MHEPGPDPGFDDVFKKVFAESLKSYGVHIEFDQDLPVKPKKKKRRLDL
jgi:hypothetical protein